MQRHGGRARALGVGALVAVCCGLLFGGVAPVTAGAATAAQAGSGNSFAQTIQLDPRTAGLSYQMTFGASLASHQNTVSRAQAQTANMGVIGSALVAPGCDGADPAISPETLPTPVKVDSREPGAAEGKTERTGSWEQTARASEKPFGESFTKLSPVDIGGIITFEGGSTRTTSGLDQKDKPQATAETNIAGISILGGLVKLDGLRWRSASRPNETDPTTMFSIESVKIAGVEAPNADALSLLDTANLVLVPLGIYIGTPKIHTDGGTTFVDPLRIAIIESKTRDMIAAQIVKAAQPLREQVFGFMLDNAPCEYSPASLILVTDILALSVTGGGSIGVNFGGTQAAARPFQAATLPFGNPAGGSGGSSGSVGSNVSSGAIGNVGSGNSGGLPSVDLSTGSAGNGSAGNGTRQALPASSSGDNDNAMWVAFAVIGLGLVLVEGELRLRRRAAKAGGVA